MMRLNNFKTTIEELEVLKNKESSSKKTNKHRTEHMLSEEEYNIKLREIYKEYKKFKKKPLQFSLLFVNQKKNVIFEKEFSEVLKNNSVLDELENDRHFKKLKNSVVKNILDKLHKFEENKEFLNLNITIISLAKKLKTNSKYLSIVINTCKGKSFILYINELRIDYVVNKLKENEKFRKYKIKSIASEIGFNTSETFSKTFYLKVGVYPSHFIKKLECKNTKSK